MKIILTLTTLLFCLSTFASSMRVMTFNTTCSVCNKGKFDKFKYRKYWIVDTIQRADPDLISMQEVLLPSQLRWFKKKLKNYYLTYYRKFFIFRYADPALFVRKDRFDINIWGGFWLGPRGGRFSLGWDKRLPRRIQYNYLTDKETGKKFLFAGSHFDNNKINKFESAKMFINRFKDSTIPVVLAADTNLKPEMEGFKILNEHLYDSYNKTHQVSFITNTDTNKDDSCNLEKGKTFPSCRVDHVFLDKRYEWKVTNWAIDQFKYGEDKNFNSDHRALYVDVELLD